MNINILGTKVHVVLVFFGALGVLMLFGCIGVISWECLLCQKGWIFFSESCYFLSGADLTWDESRQFCQNKSADLVVIDNLQEQEFIYNNMKSIYWLGLRKVGSNWVWVDGHINTLGYWVLNYDYNYYANYYGYWYAFMYRTGNTTASWRTTTSSNTLLPLCEQEVFKVSLN